MIVATLPDLLEVLPLSSSSRRAKKGPGRRPLSGKRQRFMELRAQGWSIRGAAREVGVSRTAANNWSRGYTVYRGGAAVRFVEPLDRLAVRQISARYLSEQERIEIADLHREGIGVREIAHRIGRAPSTVSRELRRNRTVGRRAGYRPFEAHRRACGRRARVRDRRIQTNPELARVVAELLQQRWSPEQISRHLRKRFPAVLRRQDASAGFTSGRSFGGTQGEGSWALGAGALRRIYRSASNIVPWVRETLVGRLKWPRSGAPREDRREAAPRWLGSTSG